MFLHHAVRNPDAKMHWTRLKTTISREKAYQATAAIGELVAEDMLDFADKSPKEIDRVYVKFRDGMPMAAGMKKILPNADIHYLVSRIKQVNATEKELYFWDGYDGYSNKTLWFADPVNATGGTAVESLRFVRKHFEYDETLISHVVANDKGIQRVQTSLDDFKSDGFLNYAYHSKRLDPVTGYLADGIELIPDFGDKVFGTLGDDYSVYDIQNDLKNLANTQVGNVELIKGTVLFLTQYAYSENYRSMRNASWITKNWLSSSIQWYCTMDELPFKNITVDEIYTLIDELIMRDFLKYESRPYKQGFVDVYSISDEGVQYSSKVYIPILYEKGVITSLKKHFDFLIQRKSYEIDQMIADMRGND